MIAFAISAESKMDTTSSGITSERRFASHKSICCVSIGYCCSFWRFGMYLKTPPHRLITAAMWPFFLVLVIATPCVGDAFDDAMV